MTERYYNKAGVHHIMSLVSTYLPLRQSLLILVLKTMFFVTPRHHTPLCRTQGLDFHSVQDAMSCIKLWTAIIHCLVY